MALSWASLVRIARRGASDLADRDKARPWVSRARLKVPAAVGRLWNLQARPPQPPGQFSHTVGFLIVLLGMGVALFLVSPHQADLLTRGMIFAILALSLDLVWGFCGILSLGQVAFFGAGGFVYAITLLQFNTPVWIAVVAAMVLPALMALGASAFIFTSRRIVFNDAVITLVLVAVLGQVFLQERRVLGGFNGLRGFPAMPWASDVRYLVVLGCLAILGGLTLWVTRSDLGLVMQATRDNEERTRFLGYSTPLIKTAAFGFGGLIAGIAGLLWATHFEFVSSVSMFSLPLTMNVLLWVGIGGRGTVVGGITGALVFVELQSQLSDLLPFSWDLAMGVVFLGIVFFAPEGIYPLLQQGLVTVARFAIPTITRRMVRTSAPLFSVSANRHLHPGDNRRLRVSDLRMAFGSFQALRRINLECGIGELHCIVGPNGAGKSTLFDVITGRLRSSGGDVFWNDHSIRDLPPEKIVRRGIGRQFQAPQVYDNLTVAQNLRLAGAVNKRVPAPFSQARTVPVSTTVALLITDFGFDRSAQNMPRELSHGAKKALELIMVLATNPSLILLDEPTAGLSHADRISIGRALRAIVDSREHGVVLIDHDIDFVRDVADLVTVLHLGLVLAQGTIDEVRLNDEVRRVYLGSQTAGPLAS
jgi:branched-chain amino acid transport system permease protein